MHFVRISTGVVLFLGHVGGEKPTMKIRMQKHLMTLFELSRVLARMFFSVVAH